MGVVQFQSRESWWSKTMRVVDRLVDIAVAFVIPPLMFGGILLVIADHGTRAFRDLGLILFQCAILLFCVRARAAK